MSIYDKLHCINADHVSIKRKVVLLRKHAFQTEKAVSFIVWVVWEQISNIRMAPSDWWI